MLDFRIRGEAGVVAELRSIVRKENGGRGGGSSRGFVGRIGFFAFFFVGDAIQVVYSMCTAVPRSCVLVLLAF